MLDGAWGWTYTVPQMKYCCDEDLFGRPQPPALMLQPDEVGAEKHMAKKRSARTRRPAESSSKRPLSSEQAEAELRRLMAETEDAIVKLERDQQVTQELLELEVCI